MYAFRRMTVEKKFPAGNRNMAKYLTELMQALKKLSQPYTESLLRTTNAKDTVIMTTTQAAVLSLRFKPEGRVRRVSSQLN
jgi:hypothetical protein